MTAIHTCSDEEAAYKDAAILVAGLLSQAQAHKRMASLVLPGGNTVREFLPRLGDQPLDWGRLQVVLADERWVATDDPASNEGLLRGLLPPDTAVTGLKTEAAEPADALATVTSRLRPIGPPFDLVFLGVGSDGHIASLFPNGTELAAIGVVTAAQAPAEPRRRLSLTLPALLNAGHMVAIMAGDKRKVLERALQPGPAEDMPLRFLLRQQRVPLSIYTTPDV